MNSGRFLFVPESQFDRVDGKQYYIELGKKKPREENLFCNIDVVSDEKRSLTKDEKFHLRHQVGRTSLLEMPVRLDPLTEHKKGPLRENSIKFDKFAKTNRLEVKRKVPLSDEMQMEKLEQERKREEAEAAFVA